MHAKDDPVPNGSYCVTTILPVLFRLRSSDLIQWLDVTDMGLKVPLNVPVQ